MKITMKRALVCGAISCSTLVLGSAVGADSASTDWPQFRGPHRDGVSSETGLVASWPEEGPKEVFRRPLGNGFSAISVVDGRLYTMFADDAERPEDGSPTGNEYAAAFDAETGEEIWRTRIGPKLFDEFGNGPKATPTVIGDEVFVLGGLGNFASLSASDGSKNWEVDIKETFGSNQATYGFATSALIEGDVVVLDIGAEEDKGYAGLDRKTGEVLWTGGPMMWGPGYGSPLLVEMDGERQVVILAAARLRAIDTAGNESWGVEWPRGETHSMPVFIPPDKFFASGAGDIGAAVYQVKKDGEAWSVDELWKSRVMKNHFSSSVYHDGHIYGFDNATFKCVDALTGEQKWAKRGLGRGSLIVADGRLIVLSDRGRLVLVEADPEAYVEVGSVQAMGGKCWTAPVLSNGRLYLRNHEEMVSYDLNG
jgi:outer membrane protein assembly factor BamB